MLKWKKKAIAATLKRKLKVRIPLEVKNGNNPAKSSIIKTVDQGEGARGKISPGSLSCT